MSNKWLYIKSGKQDAFFNMALDELLMNKVRSGELTQVISLYEWKTLTL